jgi:integrase
MLSHDVSRYIALNHAMGLKFKVQTYLLRSFAAFAEQRGEDSVYTKTVLDWAALGPSARTRRGRLLTIRRFAEAMRAEDERHEIPPADAFGCRPHRGRRERILPLWKETAIAIRSWLAVRGTRPEPELFLNARHGPMTRSGFEYILTKHVHTATAKQPSLAKKRVSPHVLRHTCAMRTLQATGDIRKVALWLGHASTQSTEIYVRADPSEKLEALVTITPPTLRRGRFSPPDKLLALLRPQKP